MNDANRASEGGASLSSVPASANSSGPDQKRAFWVRFGDLVETLLESDLDDIRECNTVLENAMSAELAGFKNRIKDEASKLDEASRDEFYEFHADSYWRFDEVFPRIVRSSLFLACYALLESRLDAYCRVIGDERNVGLTLGDIHGKGIQRAQTFLKKAAGLRFPDDTSEWSDITSFNVIRNALVHADGEVPQADKREQLVQFAKRNPGLMKLSGTHRVEIHDGFVPFVVATIRTFFSLLFSIRRSAKSGK